MASEITITCSMAFAKGNVASISRASTGLARDVTGSAYHANVQSVGTSEEAILLGDAGVGGYFWGKNLDSTNFIKIRAATGIADLVRLKAGDVCLFRIDSGATAPYAIADTATCLLEYLLIAA